MRACLDPEQWQQFLDTVPGGAAGMDGEALRAWVGGRDTIAAIGAYQREMLDYGLAAVRQSWRNARQARSANPLARLGFRGFLRLAAATPPPRRAMAAGLGA